MRLISCVHRSRNDHHLASVKATTSNLSQLTVLRSSYQASPFGSRSLGDGKVFPGSYLITNDWVKQCHSTDINRIKDLHSRIRISTQSR